MKTLLLLSIILFGYSYELYSRSADVSQKEIYNVYQYRMKLDEGELSTFYKNEQRCYTSEIEFSHTKDFYYIKSDSFDLKFYIAKITESKPAKGSVTTQYLVAKVGNPHPFSICEIHANEKFYLVVTPIRFNHMSGIDESGIVISKENVCALDVITNTDAAIVKH